jgi:two-component system OmpR family response regulator
MGGPRPHRLRFAGWTVDTAARHLISPAGVVVTLSGGEYRLLEAFLDHPQQVLSRDQLLELTRGREAGPFDRSIDVQVGRLRRRLDDAAREPRIIKTVRTAGYVLAAAVEPEA